MSNSDRSPRAATLVCLLGVLLALRLALVLSLGDVFFYGEELEKGTAAKALLNGVDWPYHQLAYHLYEGGGFVVSHLTALAFLVVGESILALKLVALLFGCLVLWAGMRLCGHHFGRRSPLLFGLLFALGPASFQKLSLLSLGIHFEACLFLLLVFDATLTLLETPRGADFSRSALVSLGLSLGFGFFFNYQLALAGLWCTLWLLVRQPRVFTGRFLWTGLAGLGVGLLPLLLMASQVGGLVFDIHGTPLATVQNNGTKLAAFLRSLYVDRAATDLVSVLLYPLAFLGSFVLLMVRGGGGAPRRNAWRLATFLLLWLGVYVSSGFVVGAVGHPFQLLRFAPLWVLATLVVSASISNLLERNGTAARRCGLGLLLVLLGWGARGTLVSMRAGSPGTWRANWDQLRSVKGYDYAGYFAKVFPRLEDPLEWARALTGFEEPEPGLLRADYAQAVTEHARCTVEECLERLPSTPESLPDFLLGLGPYAARIAGKDIAGALALGDELPVELRPVWWRAVGRFGRAYTEFPDRMAAELAGLDAGPMRADYVRGMGYRAWRRFVVGPYGTARFQLKPGAVLRWLESLPEADRASLRAGFDVASRWHHLPR